MPTMSNQNWNTLLIPRDSVNVSHNPNEIGLIIMNLQAYCLANLIRKIVQFLA